MVCGDIVQKEIAEELSKDKGCIVFDFGCYFPYSDPDKKLIFEFSVTASQDDTKINAKLNHRYPNKNYYTISKKNGRKLSKIGYPVFVDLNEDNSMMFLQIKVGYDKDIAYMVYPLRIQLTKEYPVCGLKLRFSFDDGALCFSSHKRDVEGWKWFDWFNYRHFKTLEKTLEKKVLEKNFRAGIEYCIFAEPEQINNTLLFGEVLTPFPQKLEDLLV